jgi:hypothetical protein
MSAAVEVGTEVTYNAFAGKLSEALEVVGFNHFATEGDTEFWSVDKAHGNIEVRVDYLAGDAFIETTNGKGIVTKQTTIELKSVADCRRVLNTAV